MSLDSQLWPENKEDNDEPFTMVYPVSAEERSNAGNVEIQQATKFSVATSVAISSASYAAAFLAVMPLADMIIGNTDKYDFFRTLDMPITYVGVGISVLIGAYDKHSNKRGERQ